MIVIIFIDIANTLRTFLALWKILGHWIGRCGCMVVFPYLFKVEDGSVGTRFLKRVMLQMTTADSMSYCSLIALSLSGQFEHKMRTFLMCYF